MKKHCFARLLCCFLALCLCAGSAAAAHSGIDVSRWQGEMNWSAAKAAGVEFAVLRCYSYRPDTTFDANYEAAAAEGIPVGAYVYMYAKTVEEAVREAAGALAALHGRPLTLPLFLDVEEGSVLALGKTALTDLILLELQIFEAAGYNTGVYASKNHLSVSMQSERLAPYDLWVAKWSCYATSANGKTFTFADQDPAACPAGCDLWQFSNGGLGSAFGAASDRIDLDYCYVEDLYASIPQPEHLHTFTAFVCAPTCTQPGFAALTCAACGAEASVSYAPEQGHTEADENGCCSRCGESLGGDTPNAQICPLCGEAHTGPFGWLVLLLHTLVSLFRF